MKNALLRKFPIIARPEEFRISWSTPAKTFKVGKISEDNQEIPKIADEIIRKVSKYFSK